MRPSLHSWAGSLVNRFQRRSNSVILDSDNLHFLFMDKSCTMHIQPNRTSFGILDLFKISERLGGKDLVTLFGRSTRFSGIVTREPIAKPATY